MARPKPHTASICYNWLSGEQKLNLAMDILKEI